MPFLRERKDGILPRIRGKQACRGIVQDRGFLFLGGIQRMRLAFHPAFRALRENPRAQKSFIGTIQDPLARGQKYDQSAYVGKMNYSDKLFQLFQNCPHADFSIIELSGAEQPLNRKILLPVLPSRSEKFTCKSGPGFSCGQNRGLKRVIK